MQQALDLLQLEATECSSPAGIWISKEGVVAWPTAEKSHPEGHLLIGLHSGHDQFTEKNPPSAQGLGYLFAVLPLFSPWKLGSSFLSRVPSEKGTANIVRLKPITAGVHLLNSTKQGIPESKAHQWGNCLTHLMEPVGGGAMESETIRERLNSCSLPDGESAVLRGMDIPISIFRHMGRNREARLIRRKDVVLVPEAVFLATLLLNPALPLSTAGDLIAPMLVLQFVVLLASGTHQLKGRPVVFPHLAGDVIMQLLPAHR
jgi:hypothetical protein